MVEWHSQEVPAVPEDQKKGEVSVARLRRGRRNLSALVIVASAAIVVFLLARPGSRPGPTEKTSPPAADATRPPAREQPSDDAARHGVGGWLAATTAQNNRVRQVYQQQPVTANDASAQLRRLIQDAERAEADGNLVKARASLGSALGRGLPRAEELSVRDKLAKLADRLTFSPGIAKGDPASSYYTVRSGDTLQKIGQSYHVTADLLAWVNRLPDKHRIRVNQTLKVVRGPFHALVDKRNYEMLVFLGDVLVRSYKVGLGADDGTPTGQWCVKDKLTNRTWTDPRTGKRWGADGAKNPIGEHWIGLDGLSGAAKGQVGYGIHGTIEPDSVGKSLSMGCIRMYNEDVAELFKLMVPKHSLVTVHD